MEKEDQIPDENPSISFAPAKTYQTNLKFPGALNKIELVDSISVTEDFKLNHCIPYLRDIYEDLVQRSMDPMKGISWDCMNDYIQLPGIIGVRFFAVLDVNKDKHLNEKEFVNGLADLICSNLEEKMKFIFKMYDFKGNGEISKEDVKTILSHVPLIQIINQQKNEQQTEGIFQREGGNSIVYLDRLQSMEELAQFCDFCFKDKEWICFDEFKNICENISSDMFICIFCLLKKKIPSVEKLQHRGVAINLGPRKRSSLQSTSPISKQNKIFASPLLSKLSPSHSMAKMTEKKGKVLQVIYKKAGQSPTKKMGPSPPQFNNKSILQKFVLRKEMEKEKKEKFQKSPNSGSKPSSTKVVPQIPAVHINTNFNSEKKDTEYNPIPAVRKANFTKIIVNEEEKKVIGKENAYVSPTYFLSHTNQLVSKFCSCGAQCESDKTLCKKCELEQIPIVMEGFLYSKEKTSSLQNFWIKLLNREMYFYKESSSENHLKMITLAGTFIKKELEYVADKKILYPFSILYPNNHQRTFYAVTNESRKDWVNSIKQAIGYSNITDYYNILEPIGEGKYGIVKIAIHRKSGKKVAVKILNKTKMTSQNLELVKKEVEILKICQHPNIIRLLDLFENSNYIYIVMELLYGGSLYSYLVKKRFRLPEYRASRLIHSLSTALFYLHSYGITHRDLKPENILLTDETIDADVKIADFGLSKMVGPDEKSLEPYGTLTYVAPEIILRDPYTKNVDLWSLGVICYLMLCGNFPFIDTDEVELATKIVDDEVEFPSAEELPLSPDAKDLITKLLRKKYQERISLKEVLEHEWITKYCEEVKKLREEGRSSHIESFKIFSHVEPGSPHIYDEISKRIQELDLS